MEKTSPDGKIKEYALIRPWISTSSPLLWGESDDYPYHPHQMQKQPSLSSFAVKWKVLALEFPLRQNKDTKLDPQDKVMFHSDFNNLGSVKRKMAFNTLESVNETIFR